MTDTQDTQRDVGTSKMIGRCVIAGLWYSNDSVGLLCFVQLQMLTKRQTVQLLCLFREDRRGSMHRIQVGD